VDRPGGGQIEDQADRHAADRPGTGEQPGQRREPDQQLAEGDHPADNGGVRDDEMGEQRRAGAHVAAHLLADEARGDRAEELRVRKLLDTGIEIGDREEEARGQDKCGGDAPRLARHTDEPGQARADIAIDVLPVLDGLRRRLPSLGIAVSRRVRVLHASSG
jgi:hypothetical protein